MKRKLVRIDIGYAVAGIVVEGDIVIETAPIFKWMKNKNYNEVKEWKRIKDLTEFPDQPESSDI